MVRGFRDQPLIVDYTRDVFKDKVAFRPRVLVRLQNESNGVTRTLTLLMLIDSGADVTLLPRDVADTLGLKLSKESQTSHGAAGSFLVRTADVEAWLSIEKRETSLGRIPVTVPEKSITNDASDELAYCLLGRKPLFQMYDITFLENQKKVVLRPCSKPFERPPPRR